jgi:hypothetical protein
MRAPRPTRALAAALLAITLGGCGLNNPYQRATPPTTSTTSRINTAAPPDRRDPAPERGGTIPPPERATQYALAAGAAGATPQAALERYARRYLNWTARDVVEVQRALAAISLGQARAEALQAAAGVSRDPKLTAGHIANHGQVVAISPGQAVASGKWVIVTSERTTGQGDYDGLAPTLHIIYAHVTHTSLGWVISAWQPQN